MQDKTTILPATPDALTELRDGQTYTPIILPDDPGLSIKSPAPNATPSRHPGNYRIVKGNLP
jgi:hypothetical protein